MQFTIPDINLTAVSPLLALVVTAITLTLLPLFYSSIKRWLLAGLSLMGLLISAALLLHLWDHPQTAFNGMLIMDPFVILVHLLLLMAAGLTVLLSLNQIEQEYLPYGEFYGLLLFAVCGMMILTSTSHLLIMFLGLELFSIALYILTGLRKTREDSLEAALKYFLLGAFASGFLLYGMALLYGISGTLALEKMNFVSSTPALLSAAVLLIFTGLAFKAALAPFHMWTPDVYQGAPTPITAFMSTATKATAFIVLIRVLDFTLEQTPFLWPKLLVVLAVLTMTIGNLLAISQNNVKRMLAYSSISHAGYLLVGLTAMSRTGVTAILFYLFVYTAMNIGAFGVISFMGKSGQDERVDFASWRGLAYRRPFAAFCLAVFMFALAGIPPTAGFMGKLYLFSAAVEQGYIGLVIVAVLNSVVSVYYYMRLVVNLYMTEPEQDYDAPRPTFGLTIALIVTLVLTLLWGILPFTLTNLLQVGDWF